MGVMPPRAPQPSQQFPDKHVYIPEHAQKIIDQRSAPGVGQSVPTPTAVPQPAVQPNLPPPTPDQPYDFIMDAPKTPGNGSPLPQLNSTPKRAALFVGGLFVLLILFLIIKSLLSGTSNFTLLVGVAQDQQEILHLTSTVTNASQQQNLSAADQNFAATTSASIGSSQTTLATYMAANKHKLNPKTLNLKVSKALDDQLVTAQANGTYDQTFQQILKGRLTSYSSDLSQAYQKTKGSKGRALLASDYSQAKLLLKQLAASGQ
jgi:hypothetical protein